MSARSASGRSGEARAVPVEWQGRAREDGEGPATSRPMERPRVEIVRHTGGSSGSALATGVSAALRRGADIVVTITGEDAAPSEGITALVRPIAEGWADHVRVSPDRAATNARGRGPGRRLDNIGLTFLTKLCSGYWNVLDIESGVVATRADALARVPLDKLSDLHFHADLLVQLNIIEARVADLPLADPATPAPAVAPFGLAARLLLGLARRVFWRYLFYDVSPVATFALTGGLLAAFGLCFGGLEWATHAARGVPTPNGTIMLAVAPLLVGFQLLLHAVLLDIASTPRASGATLGLSLPAFSPRWSGPPRLSGAPDEAVSPAPHPLERGRVLSTLTATAVVLTCIALGDLALRAALRLETRWDTLVYHLPFAAVRGGVPLPFEMSDLMRPIFEGFPPLPHVVQGVLWRLTGSANATGVVNLIAFSGFLAYCQWALRAPFWLVAPIALTAPTVIIQCSASYVDLFANSYLAAGVCSCLRLFLFPAEPSRAVLVGGLLALVFAAWSKFQLVVVVALVLCIVGAMILGRSALGGLSRRRAALLWSLAALLAAAPYLKNLWLYHNPFWPIRLPVFGDLAPYTRDAITEGDAQRPPMMRDVSQFWLFVHSLFEIDHPTRYATRPRWNIDQGNAWLAFRMGGFWGVAAGVYLPLVAALLVVYRRHRGAIAALGVLGVLAFVAHLPQAHELRYYMFIPLAGAGIIGMSFPRLRELAPRCAAALLALVLGLFLYMVSENRVHYLIEPVTPAVAARELGADVYWPRLDRNRTYCAVNMWPIALLLTGPTLSEYRIVDRSKASLCPPGSERLTR